ncbi:MAG TPA: VOC family protein [Flavipsychrobacter sp.]|nr:VOC family protein [Flavipsychrobacter sp.]
MRAKMTLITLGVSNFEKSLSFYKDGLGWNISKDSGDDVAFIPLGGIILALYPKDLLAKDAQISPEGSGFSGITLAHNTKSEQEVDEVLETAKQLGAKILKNGQKVFWGGYNGYFADLDGYVWEIAYNPFWQFDENDNIILP